MKTTLWVYVEFSESNLLEDGKMYEFKEFESKASLTAQQIDFGYDKTKITAYFSTDEATMLAGCTLY